MRTPEQDSSLQGSEAIQDTGHAPKGTASSHALLPLGLGQGSECSSASLEVFQTSGSQMDVHPQQVISHGKIFGAVWPHEHVQARVLITLSCTSEDWEGSELGWDTTPCMTSGNSLTLCEHQTSYSLIQTKTRKSSFFFCLVCIQQACVPYPRSVVPVPPRARSTTHPKNNSTRITAPCNGDTTEPLHFEPGFLGLAHTKRCQHC